MKSASIFPKSPEGWKVVRIIMRLGRIIQICLPVLVIGGMGNICPAIITPYEWPTFPSSGIGTLVVWVGYLCTITAWLLTPSVERVMYPPVAVRSQQSRQQQQPEPATATASRRRNRRQQSAGENSPPAADTQHREAEGSSPRTAGNGRNTGGGEHANADAIQAAGFELQNLSPAARLSGEESHARLFRQPSNSNGNNNSNNPNPSSITVTPAAPAVPSAPVRTRTVTGCLHFSWRLVGPIIDAFALIMWVSFASFFDKLVTCEDPNTSRAFILGSYGVRMIRPVSWIMAGTLMWTVFYAQIGFWRRGSL